MPRTYLAALALAGAIAFALIWAWVATMPLAFLDPEYPAWLAKEQMLARCDLGSLLVVGDSRAAVDIEPTVLPVKTTNLAVGGGEPIEAYSAVRRALACPEPPGRVIVSFDAGHFVRPDLLWERSVGFGFLDTAEVAELRRVSQRLGDMSIYGMKRADGLPPRVRAALYSVRFPSLYFASLLHGGVLMRWWENAASLRRAIASRGQYFFGTAAGSDEVAVEGDLDRFAPLPVLDWYFDHMLALLAARGIEVDFVAMPMNEATARAVQPALRYGVRRVFGVLCRALSQFPCRGGCYAALAGPVLRRRVLASQSPGCRAAQHRAWRLAIGAAHHTGWCRAVPAAA